MSSRRLLLAAFCALVVATVGCGGEQTAPKALGLGRFELLRSLPDAILEQVGRVEPDDDEQWGVLGTHGWENATRSKTGKQRIPHVWSKERLATLDLPTGVARDRTLRITLFGPEEGPGQEVQVRLNGVELGRTDLTTRPRTIDLAAPAATWRTGRNVLELEAERRTELEDGRTVGLAVCSVVYDEPSAVEVRPGEQLLRLGPQTAAVYHLEVLVPTRLLLHGAAQGRGRLGLRLLEIDPRTGDEAGELFASEVELEDQPLERGLAIPPLEGTFARLVLSFASDEPDAGFVVSSLQRVEESPPPRPPVIFISIDTLSARHLPFYGYPRDTAPRLSELASESVVFEHCLANAPWTLPSFMAAFTGLYSYAHRLQGGGPSRPLWEQWYLAENRWTFAEVLRAAGYDTAAIVAHEWLTPQYGFGQGFDHFDNEASSFALAQKTRPSGGARLVVEKALSWLEGRRAEEPFLLFLHFMDVHGPYSTLPGFRDRFDGDRLYDPEHEAPVGGSPSTLGIIHEYHLPGSEYAEVAIPARVPTASFADAYDEGILAVDDALGKLIAELRRRGLFDQSLIVLSADHGESMADSDLIFAHGLLEPAVLHVPLLMRLPGGREGGKRVPQTVQLVDLHATLLDLLGIGPRDYLHGTSLLPMIEGEEAAPRTIYSEGGLSSQRCVVRDGWKLVQRNPSAEAPPPSLLSRPGLLQQWSKEILPWARTQKWPRGRYEQLAQTGPLHAFQRIQAEGLHRGLMEELEKDPAYPTVLQVLRRFFDREELHLYDLRRDPDAKVDVAAEHPEKVAELLRALEEERGRMQRALEDARPPGRPVELSAEAMAQLKSLGYTGD